MSAPEKKETLQIAGNKFLETFIAARKAGTPLICIQTPDPASTMQLVSKVCAQTKQATILSWDIVQGLLGFSKEGRQMIKDLLGDKDESVTVNPVETLNMIANCEEDTIIFFQNAHRIITEQGISQAIWNLRDLFKEDGRILIMLCPSIVLPEEISQDVLIIDEPLPTEEELSQLVTKIHTEAEIELAPPSLPPAIDALIGLASFPAEQVTAMSLSRKGLDLDSMWERKRKMIEQTPGLSVWRGGETFESIGGINNVKTFLKKVIAGKKAPRVIVFIDEIEKALAGAGNDLSGVSQEMLGTFLTWMQDQNVTGIIAIGPPGSAKSMVAKATGNTAKIPTVQMDLSGMKGSLVGESGKNLRAALKVVNAIGGGSVMAIATCNSIGVLPPELRRRFTFGTFFFDLPSAEERAVIWSIYLQNKEIENSEKLPVFPDDSGWTGAEIKQCCEIADRLNITLKDAAEFIVPVAKSAGDQIERLRVQASGRFISASTPGIYLYDKEEKPTSASAPRRRINPEDN